MDEITNIPEYLEYLDSLGLGRGHIPRNYSVQPSGYHACAPTFSDALIIPENEWASRLKDQQQAQASLWDVREANYETLKSLNQGRIGICWAFSTTKAIMYLRSIMNLQPAILSAWWVAGRVKGWRDQGGNGSESLAEVARDGVPEMSLCPSYSSQYDNAACRANAALHKATAWWDGTESRAQNKRIMVSAFLMGLPPVIDFDWLSHSMAGCRLVSIDPLVVDCDNSWSDTNQFGAKGTYRLTGNQAIPDGIVVPRVTMA